MVDSELVDCSSSALGATCDSGSANGCTLDNPGAPCLASGNGRGVCDGLAVGKCIIPQAAVLANGNDGDASTHVDITAACSDGTDPTVTGSECVQDQAPLYVEWAKDNYDKCKAELDDFTAKSTTSTVF